MTEKDFKKMKHFLNNKSDNDTDEMISYIQKKENKGITAEEWNGIFEIVCNRRMAGLQKWILKSKMQLGKETIKYVCMIADGYENRLEESKKQADMISVMQKHIPEEFEQDMLGTAFVLACKNNNIYLVKFLLEQGADVSFSYQKETGIEAALGYSESITGNGDETLYRYLQRNQNVSREWEDVEKYYAEEDMWGSKIYTPDKNACKEYENELVSIGSRKRAEFVAHEYGYENLLDKDTTADMLALSMEEYNWDDGLELPYYIAMHVNCELATALKIFWEGEGILKFLDEFENTANEKWKYLLETVYNRILNGDYRQKEQHYKIPLDKAQRYELKKQGVADIFLNDL